MRCLKILLRLAFLAFIIFISKEADAQVTSRFIDDYSVVDSAKLEIVYRVEIINDVKRPNSKSIDIQKLLIGNHVTKIFSNTLYYYDSLSTKMHSEGIDNVPMCQEWVPPVEVFKYNSEKKLKVTYRTLTEDVFIYEEDTPDFHWVMQKDRKTILNYPCQKATANFRGRNYEAWFTPSIPFSDGPYKFSGLPGLILEIRDTQGHYVFQCVGIKKPQPLQPIKFWEWPYTKTTREKLLDYLKRMHQNPIEYFKSKGQTFGTMENGKIVDNPKNFSWPYNPIELE